MRMPLGSSWGVWLKKRTMRIVHESLGDHEWNKLLETEGKISLPSCLGGLSVRVPCSRSCTQIESRSLSFNCLQKEKNQRTFE